MGRMFSIVVLVTGLVMTSATIHAEDLIQCVDPAVRDTLLGGWAPTTLIVTDVVPGGFPAMSLPDSFLLIGGRTLGDSQSVAFEVKADDETTRVTLNDHLTTQGWYRYDQGRQGRAAGSG